ncbi:MAG: hypothetical protein A3H32_04175 [Betaproteobacteria bacterium RIFCSPLOWO2_02_FULL_63_19]|nr:MAG: hypothetical protein A3H32_04175 [Betaproteobacteria bacterium RIFCSPLOWO2_02_FULL_63_19]
MNRLKSGILLWTGIVGLLSAAYFGFSAIVLSAALTPRPAPHAIRSPLDDDAEAVRFASARDGVPLAGWLMPSHGTRAIVLVHGVDSASWDGGHPDLARAYVSAGFHVLAFDLRGHGRSGGKRLGLGWDERGDVRAAVDLLLARGFKPGAIGVHGTSYGAATALLAAADIPEVGAVVADSAFSDVRDLMTAQIESRTSAPTWLASTLASPGIESIAWVFHGLDLDRIQPMRAVPAIAPRPILFIHGNDDDVIPVRHAYRLKAASRNPADRIWVLRGRGHTEGIRLGHEQQTPSPLREMYLAKVVAFFDSALNSNENE